MKWRAVKLPVPLIEQIDDLRAERRLSRAKLITEALRGPLPELREMDEAEFRACLEEQVRAGRAEALRLWSQLYLPKEPPVEESDPFDAQRSRSERPRLRPVS